MPAASLGSTHPDITSVCARSPVEEVELIPQLRSLPPSPSHTGIDAQPYFNRTKERHRRNTIMSKKSGHTRNEVETRSERDQPKAVSADVKQMHAYKRLFHGRDPATYRVLPEQENSKVHPRTLHGTFSECKKELLAASAEGAMILMNVHRMDAAGAKSENVLGIQAAYIDQDHGFDPKKLKRLKLPPGLIVRTSKDRGHSLWLLKDCDPETFRLIQSALAKKFDADPSRTSPAYLNRMAGSVHYKGTPRLVEIVRIDKRAKPISAKKFIKELGLKIENATDKKPEAHVAASLEAVEADIRSALPFVPVAEKRKDWLRILMAIHSEMPNEAGFALGVEWSRQSPKFDEKDQRRTWNTLHSDGKVRVATLFAEAAKHGWKNPASKPESDLPCTEFELVDSFADSVRDRLRYNESLKKWMVFKQPVWRVDEPAAVQCARGEIERMLVRAKDSDDTAALVLLKKYASVPGVRSLLSHATSHPKLVVRHQVFDRVPNLLAVQNGVVDLATGALRDGRPDDFLIRQAAATYDAQAKAPKFRAFIDFLTCSREDYVVFIQTLLGYMVRGEPVEQKMVVAVGDGSNGKGVLNRRLEYVLGDYVTTVPPNLLTNAYSGNPHAPTPAFMALHGARLYLCGEGQEQKRFDTTFLKQLSGNDTFMARGGYADPTEFRPVGTLWMAVNSLPDVDRQDKAMWRRLLILPCDAEVTKPGRSFEKDLDAEAAGILNWLIEGAIRYQKHGLGTCDAVKEAGRYAKRAFDTVALWIDACCKVKADATVKGKEAYRSYCTFCRSEGRHALSIQKFNKAMNKKGHHTEKQKTGNRYTGLRLIEG